MADEILAQVKATLMSGVASWRDIQTNGARARDPRSRKRARARDVCAFSRARLLFFRRCVAPDAWPALQHLQSMAPAEASEAAAT